MNEMSQTMKKAQQDDDDSWLEDEEENGGEPPAKRACLEFSVSQLLSSASTNIMMYFQPLSKARNLHWSTTMDRAPRRFSTILRRRSKWRSTRKNRQ